MNRLLILFLPLFALAAIKHAIFAPIANETYQERGRCTALAAINTPLTTRCQIYLKHTNTLLKLEDRLTNNPTPAQLSQYRNDLLNEHKNVRILSSKIDAFIDKAIRTHDMKTLSYLLESAYFMTTMSTKKRISQLPNQEALSQKARHILYKYLHTTYAQKKALRQEQARNIQADNDKAICTPLNIRYSAALPHTGTVHATVVGVLDEGYVLQKDKQFLLLLQQSLDEELGIGQLLHIVAHTDARIGTYTYEESDRFMQSSTQTRKLLHINYLSDIDKKCYN